MTAARPRVGILLSTFDGARFLPDQLRSFRAQTGVDWRLWWRDDGSGDDTVAIMERFAADCAGACVQVPSSERIGPCASFMALLHAAAPSGLPLAFADQDDVWLPDKLARALAALRALPGPALYCSRQQLVDERLRPLGLSTPLRRPPGFPAALAQNIVTGCTAVLDPAAVDLVRRSRPPADTLHDWWSYIVVTAAGGRVHADPAPSVLYRQHGTNVVGAPASRWRRGRAALRRGPAVFMAVLRRHVDALAGQPELLSADARRVLLRLRRALGGGPLRRLLALATPGLVRQTRAETVLFRLWFLLS